MGWYQRQVLPRIVHVSGSGKAVGRLRRRACAGLAGEVAEIGFGSGLNVPYYPGEVTAVAAIEPADLAWKMAGRRVAASPVPVTRQGLDGQSLPLADDSCDAVLSTFTLCTIPDADAALRELRRVLKPGGSFHFAEHGLAPDEPVRRWQRRLEPVQKQLFGGCHLTRRITGLITGAGFTISDVDVFYLEGTPKFGGAMSMGTAISP
ncbi:MAG TPA: class I SAM-dependent methyltransferase [Streptosporangiaceae bacterium]|jgi:SAM-dependent methyltransferase